MPQVASDTQAFPINRPLPPSRPAPSYDDQAPATPFASLLDDSTKTEPDSPPPAPAADDRPTRAGEPNRAVPPDRDNAAKPAKADAKPADAPASADTPAIAADVSPVVTGDSTKPGKTGKSSSNSKAIADGKTTADAKLADQPTTAVDPKAASDVKPVDGQTPAVVVATAAPAATPIPVLPAVDAPLLAPETSADAAVAGTPPAAVVAIAVATAALVAEPKVKTAAPATWQADGTKATAPAKLPAHAASQPQTDGKPQATAADVDKTDAVADARGEPAGGKADHHAATVGAPGAATADSTTATPKAAVDAMQPANLNAPSQNTPTTAAATPAAPPQLAPQAAAIPLSGVAFDIASKAAAGTNHFEIRLDPPELGKIEVRLDVDKDGNVTTRMIADRSDTLDLLRRDAPGLERALQDAGLKTADNSLQFSLRDQSSQQQQDNSGARTTRLVVEDNTLPLIDAAQRGYSRLAGQGSGIDIHV